jgi:hypothetical protein
MVEFWKAASAMVVGGMLVLVAFFAAMNSSAWGYQVGDRAVLKAYAVGAPEFENFTLAYSVGAMTISLVRLDREVIMANGTTYSDSEWLDKDTETPFDLAITRDNNGTGAIEMVSTPMGNISCRVFVYDDDQVHIVTWVHNGLPVKYIFHRLGYDGFLHEDLVEIPAKYL